LRRSRGRLSHSSCHRLAVERDGGRRQSNANFHRRTAAALMKAPSLTIGIEEEYQIIDPETRELRSYITEILAGDHMILDEVKPELHQSMVEIGSKVCRAPSELRSELVRLRGLVVDDTGDHTARTVCRRS